MKIGNAGGFWGDDLEGPRRLVEGVPDLDYLTLDYLAELSLSIMAAQKAKNPELGYASDFIKVIKTLIPMWEKGLKFKIVTNAGGLNPEGLKKELARLLPHKKIAAVGGDDVLDFLRKSPETIEFYHLEKNRSLTEVVEKLTTANAYLGADKIVEALDAGAEIVVTGRVADPSMTVGPAIHHFKWKANDYHKIAQATVAGHLLECGAQATGGISTDWLTLDNPWDIGFPYVELEDNGDFIVTKPENSAGRVTVAVIKEQLLYEISDPAHYLSPDSTVSFLALKLEQVGKNRVKVSGALGSPPNPTYKVSATFAKGWKTEGTLVFIGNDSKKHALKAAEVILKKAPVLNSLIETYGDNGETFLRLAASDPDKQALEKFLKQFAPLVTAGPPGTTGYTGGQGKIRPIFEYWPCLIKRSLIDGKA